MYCTFRPRQICHWPKFLPSIRFLLTLSEHISTLDLHNLARTCETLHAYIQSGNQLFRANCRQSLCEGLGVKARKDFREPFYDRLNRGGTRYTRGDIQYEEEIEVNIWALECDEVDALPCRRCGINVCEQCRGLDRLQFRAYNDFPRRPFDQMWEEAEHYYACCHKRDAATDKELAGQFLNEECDCDTWSRWLCFKCASKERFASNIHNWNSLHAFHDYELCGCEEKRYECGHDPELVVDGGLNWRKYKVEVFMAVQGAIIVYAPYAGLLSLIQLCVPQLTCPCGEWVPAGMRTRCIWCRRRHALEPGPVLESKCVKYEEDLTYPLYEHDKHPNPVNRQAYQRGEYPKLEYEGPIWTEAERLQHVASLQAKGADAP